MPYMPKATLVLDFKAAQGDLIVQMVLWQLPKPTKDRPQGLKYRLYLGQAGQPLARYDNETGKGHHRHLGANEAQSPYGFSSIENLMSDFRTDCERFGWRWDK